MDKRLQKRHKRQVARAKERVKLSEPDVRTPEQIRAAREASQAASSGRSDAHMQFSSRPSRTHAAPIGNSSAKVGD